MSDELRKPEQPKTPRCPLCDGAMAERASRNGRFLGCLRYPDCKGKRQIDQPVAGIKGEEVQRTLVVSPILYLTGAAISGLCANPEFNGESAASVAETAVAIARNGLLELKRVANNANS